MDYEIRYATADEFASVAEIDGANFGFHYSAEELADAALDVDPDRVLVAGLGSRIVGISAELPFAIRLPGGADVPTTGLTWLSVELTHRRRGVLRARIERQLRAAAEWGDAAAILMASEGRIYGRFGFGVATVVRHRPGAGARHGILSCCVRCPGTRWSRASAPRSPASAPRAPRTR